MDGKSQYEIFFFFLQIVLVAMKKQSIMLWLFYGNFLRFKYVANPNMQRSFYKLNQQILAALSAPLVPAFVKTLYLKISGLLTYLVKFN